MRIAFLDPFIRTMGGGEKYILSIAEYVSELGHDAHIIVDDPQVDCDAFAQYAHQRLQLDLTKAFITPIPWSPGREIWRRSGFYPTRLRDYDLVIYLTNQLPHVTFNRNSLAIVQFPFEGKVRLRATLRDLRQCIRHRALGRMRALVVYSRYTARWVQKLWGRESIVVPPPIDTGNFRPGDKQNLILSVGRFDEAIHNKKQPEMVQVFRRMVNEGLRGWEMVLAGGVRPGNETCVDRLRAMAAGYPVQIRPNIPFDGLCELYARSRIFWHATGLNEDEAAHPERLEHFGMTTVEAMSAGCVPVVISMGGQPEVVEHGKSGFLWRTPEELSSYTRRLIESQDMWEAASKAAAQKSRQFSKEAFRESILSVLSRYTDGWS